MHPKTPSHPSRTAAWGITMLLALSTLGLTSACKASLDGAVPIDQEEPVDPDPKDNNTPGVTPADQCMPMDRFFVREVWAKVADANCAGCHFNDGSAGNTDFILYHSDGYSDHVERNFESLSRIARERIQDQGFESKLLLKPLGELEHGGGKRFEKDSPSYKILEEFVNRLDKVDPCPTPEDKDFFEDFEYLSGKELARKASLSLAGRLPSEEELQAIDADADAGVDALLNTLMSEEAFGARLIEGFNDVFLTDYYFAGEAPENIINRTHYPNLRWYDAIEDGDARNRALRNVRYGLTREVLELIKHVVLQDKPFTEIITADYVMVNPFSAKSYGVDDKVTFVDTEDHTEFVPVTLPATPNTKSDSEMFPHSGILTSYIYLNRYPSTATNKNRHRARVFYEQFLGTDLLELAPRGGDPTTVASYPNAIRDADACANCHVVMDPVAGAFQNFNNNGQYGPLRDGWYTDTFTPGFEGEAMTVDDFKEPLRWLAARTIKNRQFAVTMVGHAYKLMMGRAPLSMPKDPNEDGFLERMRAYEVQREWLKVTAENFKQDNFNFKNLLRTIVKSKYYRVKALKSAPTPERAAQVHDVSTGRLLTPEQLQRKIVAVFGINWRYNGRDAFRDGNEFKYLYGGIDSNQVTERLSEPNGVMGGIQTLMANDLACTNTVKDFEVQVDQRRLFPHVEPTSVPGTDDDAIKRNIQHLYAHVLGQNLELSDKTIADTFDLFVSIQQEGAAAAALEEGGLSKRLDGHCDGETIKDDELFTLRAWRGVLSYILTDYTFLYE